MVTTQTRTTPSTLFSHQMTPNSTPFLSPPVFVMDDRLETKGVEY